MSIPSKDPTQVHQPRPNQVNSGGWTQENQPDWGGESAELGDDEPTIIAVPEVSADTDGDEPLKVADGITNNYKDRPDQSGAAGAQGQPEDASTPDRFNKEEYRPGRPPPKDHRG
jgi:hypothetical protein